MKPITKLQHEVVYLAKKLPYITNRQEVWAKKECLEHKGFATKNKVNCLDCGESFSPDLVKRNKTTCPYCKTKLIIEQTLKRTAKQVVYFAIAEVYGEFQVIRNYELIAYYKTGESAQYYICEILQYWILPNGKYEIFGRKHTLNWYADSWNGSMEIRKERSVYYNSTRYQVYPFKYSPDSEFKPVYQKYGIDHNLTGISFLEAIKLLPDEPKAETLLKAKEHSLLVRMTNNRGDIYRYWQSIKICLRNKYKIKDASMWIDYLDLLRYFNKDLHNAKYVCPKNLKSEHDKLVRKKKVIQERLDREREKQEPIERQKNLEKAIIDYIERNSRFFELEIKNKEITIEVLKSVDEFKLEGEELEHCVYTNEYYLKEKSLILSAKVAGVRTETIELNLNNFKIEQSRGYDNKPTEYHDKIVKLLKRNLKKIETIYQQSA